MVILVIAQSLVDGSEDVSQERGSFCDEIETNEDGFEYDSGESADAFEADIQDQDQEDEEDDAAFYAQDVDLNDPYQIQAFAAQVQRRGGRFGSRGRGGRSGGRGNSRGSSRGSSTVKEFESDIFTEEARCGKEEAKR